MKLLEFKFSSNVNAELSFFDNLGFKIGQSIFNLQSFQIILHSFSGL